MEKSVEQIMETTYKFHTLVKKDHKFGDNQNVIGRINGWKEVICDGLMEKEHKILYALAGIDEGIVLTTRCTPDKYAKFTKVVKAKYPDLCEFNWSN